jgi:hypothetical protein
MKKSQAIAELYNGPGESEQAGELLCILTVQLEIQTEAAIRIKMAEMCVTVYLTGANHKDMPWTEEPFALPLPQLEPAAFNDGDLVIASFLSVAIDGVRVRWMIEPHKRHARRLAYDLRTNWSCAHRKRLGKPCRGVNAKKSPRVL